MKISGLQKVSLVDYNENITATIFTSGCNFACPFCHNAGLVKGSEPEIIKEEVLDYLKKRKNILNAVCISGGEPTLHHDLPEFIKEIKGMGYLVKLDTNGTNIDMVKYLVENKLIDYIAMDIKNSPSKYNKTIGKDYNFNQLQSIKYIMSCGVDYEFRTTIIEGYHKLEDIEEICKSIKGANRYFIQKFEDSGNCLSSGLNAIDYDTATQFLSVAKKYIKIAKLRGY